jgi:hypothetical protein
MWQGPFCIHTYMWQGPFCIYLPFWANSGKDDMCKCGCKGWCTWFPILLTLAWDLQACSLGKHGPLNQYGKPRELSSNADLNFVIAVIEVRADWPAWTNLSGMRIWAHKVYPCPKCDSSVEMINNVSQWGLVTLNTGPWKPYQHHDYLADIRRHKIVFWFCRYCYFILVDICFLQTL